MAGQMIGGGLGGLGGLGIGDETGVAAAQLGMAHPAMQQAMHQGMQQQGMQPHGMMQPGMQPQAAQWQVRNSAHVARVEGGDGAGSDSVACACVQQFAQPSMHQHQQTWQQQAMAAAVRALAPHDSLHQPFLTRASGAASRRRSL